MNKITLLGRLVRDPEIRYSNSAQPTAIARYTLAVKRKYAKEGQQDTDLRKNGLQKESRCWLLEIYRFDCMTIKKAIKGKLLRSS